jgi:hypothetical protein
MVRMSRAAYIKSEPGKWAREGVRVAGGIDLSRIGDVDVEKICTILEAMKWQRLIVFGYGESDRVVAPFVVGVSSDGNPLMRGYQLEGKSRSGKGEGWRVFRVDRMGGVEDYQEFFECEDFDFDESYPWIYKIFRMVEEG